MRPSPVSLFEAPPPGPTRLAARDLTLGYDDAPVVAGLDLAVPDGRVTAIVGANASGKSTLLRGMSRLLRPRQGTVLLDGRDIQRTPGREVARTLGLLPQSPTAPEGLTVVDLVGRGRAPHQGSFRRWSEQDEEAVARALRLTDTLDLADAVVDELSGGQRQRVWIAMALAQETDLLLLDEPTTYLDVAHQMEVLELLTRLNADRGTTIVMVLHELDLAARYADHLVAMADGRVVAQGEPATVLTRENVAAVFGIDCLVGENPATHTPMVIPLSRRGTGSAGSAPAGASDEPGTDPAAPLERTS